MPESTAKKTKKSSKKSVRVESNNVESIDERIEKASKPARNWSREGFDQEGIMAERMSSYSKIEQKKGSMIGTIDPDSLKTNFKATINDKDYAETDCQFDIILNYNFGWLPRALHLNKFLNNVFNTIDVDAVNYQSKLFSGVVPNDVVLHALIQMYKMKRAGDNLRARTFVVAEEKDKGALEEKDGKASIKEDTITNAIKENSKELELLLKYHIPVYTEDELGQEYEVIKKKGANRVRMNRYINSEWEKNYNVNLGSFVILDEGHLLWKKPVFANIIYVSSLNDEYDKVMEAIRYIKSMNTEYYIFATPKGNQIVGEAKYHLNTANVEEVSYENAYSILQNGNFYQNFVKINPEVFGLTEEERGRAKRQLKETLFSDIGSIPLLKEKKVENAISNFVTKMPKFRHN